MLSSVSPALLPPSSAQPGANLTPAIGVSGPHDFAIRIRRPRQKRHPRPPLPRPALVRCATPLSMGRDAGIYSAVVASGKQKYFCRGGLTRFLVIGSDLPVGVDLLKWFDNPALVRQPQNSVAPASEPGPIRRGLTMRHERRTPRETCPPVAMGPGSGAGTTAVGVPDLRATHHAPSSCFASSASPGAGGVSSGTASYRAGMFTGWYVLSCAILSSADWWISAPSGISRGSQHGM